MKRLAVLLGLLITPLCPVSGQAPVGPRNRAEAVKIISGLREIVSPQGLQGLCQTNVAGEAGR